MGMGKEKTKKKKENHMNKLKKKMHGKKEESEDSSSDSDNEGKAKKNLHALVQIALSQSENQSSDDEQGKTLHGAGDKPKGRLTNSNNTNKTNFVLQDNDDDDGLSGSQKHKKKGVRLNISSLLQNNYDSSDGDDVEGETERQLTDRPTKTSGKNKGGAKQSVFPNSKDDSRKEVLSGQDKMLEKSPKKEKISPMKGVSKALPRVSHTSVSENSVKTKSPRKEQSEIHVISLKDSKNARRSLVKMNFKTPSMLRKEKGLNTTKSKSESAVKVRDESQGASQLVDDAAATDSNGSDKTSSIQNNSTGESSINNYRYFNTSGYSTQSKCKHSEESSHKTNGFSSSDISSSEESDFDASIFEVLTPAKKQLTVTNTLSGSVETPKSMGVEGGGNVLGNSAKTVLSSSLNEIENTQGVDSLSSHSSSESEYSDIIPTLSGVGLSYNNETGKERVKEDIRNEDHIVTQQTSGDNDSERNENGYDSNVDTQEKRVSNLSNDESEDDNSVWRTQATFSKSHHDSGSDNSDLGSDLESEDVVIPSNLDESNKKKQIGKICCASDSQGSCQNSQNEGSSQKSQHEESSLSTSQEITSSQKTSQDSEASPRKKKKKKRKHSREIEINETVSDQGLSQNKISEERSSPSKKTKKRKRALLEHNDLEGPSSPKKKKKKKKKKEKRGVIDEQMLCENGIDVPKESELNESMEHDSINTIHCHVIDDSEKNKTKTDTSLTENDTSGTIKKKKKKKRKKRKSERLEDNSMKRAVNVGSGGDSVSDIQDEVPEKGKKEKRKKKASSKKRMEDLLMSANTLVESSDSEKEGEILEVRTSMNEAETSSLQSVLEREERTGKKGYKHERRRRSTSAVENSLKGNHKQRKKPLDVAKSGIEPDSGKFLCTEADLFVSDRICQQIHFSKTLRKGSELEDLIQFARHGFQVRQGRWIPAEDQHLLKNWTNFLLEFPTMDFEPKNLLDHERDSNDWTEVEDFIRDTDFYCALAKNLNRLTYRCFRRAQRLVLGRGLNELQEKEGMEGDIKKKILEQLNSSEGSKSIKSISRELQVSEESVRGVVRFRQDKDVRVQRWDQSEDDKLTQSICRILNVQSISEDTDISGLPWQEIAKSVPTRTAVQCRHHFTQTLYPRLMSAGTVNWTSEEYELLRRTISSQNIKQSSQIRWDAIREVLGSHFTISILKQKWNKLIRKIDNYKKLPFTELCRCANDVELSTYRRRVKTKKTICSPLYIE